MSQIVDLQNELSNIIQSQSETDVNLRYDALVVLFVCILVNRVIQLSYSKFLCVTCFYFV